MNAHRRPGGLTALAVINFIFGGFAAIGVLGYVGLMFLARNPRAAGPVPGTPEQQAQIDALLNMGQGMFLALTVCSAVMGALLIISGIGYLKQKRFLGRTLGNATAVLSIAVTIATGSLMAPQVGGGFNLGAVINLIYPVLTLFLLNVTFKEDFVNP